MDFRRLGHSGLKVPALSFGTATFGGTGDFFKAWGNTDTAQAKKLVDICLDRGVNFFDTANGYSKGLSEEILGEVLKGRRNQCLISTKCTFPMGDGPNEFGSSRFHILESCHASLKRLQTDHIDLFHMHGFDANTPIEETLNTLDQLIRSGKVRYIACSNFSGWHLMKSLSVSEKHSWNKYIAHQIYYSLVGREAEWELLPLALDQGVGSMVWSPLAGGALTGKIRRNKPAPKDSRLGQIDFVSYDEDVLYKVIDELDLISKETNKSIAQIALRWVLQRPTVANVIIGARSEEQLTQNLAVLDFTLSNEHMERLNKASETRMLYPYWHQRWFPQLVNMI